MRHNASQLFHRGTQRVLQARRNAREHFNPKRTRLNAMQTYQQVLSTRHTFKLGVGCQLLMHFISKREGKQLMMDRSRKLSVSIK